MNIQGGAGCIYEVNELGLQTRYYQNNLEYGCSGSDIFASGTGTFIRSGTVTSNPLFINYTGDATGDYHLQSTSPAINNGTSTGAPSTDFDGITRPQGSAYDIGAYEWH